MKPSLDRLVEIRAERLGCAFWREALGHAVEAHRAWAAAKRADRVWLTRTAQVQPQELAS